MATKPNQLKQDPLKFEFNTNTFFTAAKGFCINALDGDWGSAANTAYTTLKNGLTNDESPEYRAKLLLHHTLIETVSAVLSDSSIHRNMVNDLAKAETRKANYSKDLVKRFTNIEVSIDPDFFDSPQTSDFTKAIRPIFKDWLIGYLRFSEHQADALAATLPYQFTRQLAKEWSGNEDLYQSLITWKDNPFFPAYKKLQQQAAYQATLLGYYARPAFNDARIALAEMYMAPFFRVHNRCIPDEFKKKFYEKNEAEKSTLERQDEFLQPRIRKNLHEYLLEVLVGKSPIGLPAEAMPLTLLLGQPGQGKTSFCYHTIYQLLEKYKGKKDSVHFIRLKSITNFEDLIKEPLEELSKFIAKKYFASTQPLELEDWENSLLILDGLDELCMNKSLSKDQVQTFIANLRSNLKTLEQTRLKVLLTSRYNYVKLEDLPKDKVLILRLDELRLSQQLEWLEKYKGYEKDCQLEIAQLEKIHKGEEKQHQELRKLLNQPILLQLIASSTYKIDERANRSQIYKSLFDTILNRKWDDGAIEKFDKFQKNNYRKFLRVLALHIYQSEHEYARRSDFEKEGELLSIIERIKRKSGNQALDIKDMVKDLLVNFYFQEVATEQEDPARKEENENFAFEFLHKSLQEYLVAEHIWETFKTKFLAEEDEEYRVQKTDQALEIIYPLFAPKFLSEEIVDYLREIIRTDEDLEKKAALQQHLQFLLPKLIKRDFILPAKLLDLHPMNAALSTFHGYWTVFSSGFDEKELPLAIEHEAYIAALSTALDFQSLEENSIRQRFEHLLYTLQRLHTLKVNLRYQFLAFIKLEGANLSEADLRGAGLYSANLRGIYLEGANLRGAVLDHADLRGASLKGADFRGASLEGADFRGADLNGVDFSGANLHEANFCKTNLGGANFCKTNLEGANLRGANLVQADFYETDLNGVNFSDANFNDANLIRVKNLEKVLNLTKAKNLHLASFRGTIYEGKFKKPKEEQED